MTDMQFICSTFISAIEPKVILPIDEWVDAGHVSLPANTAEPGIYSLSRTPYQRGVLRALSPQDPTRYVTLCFGAQLGKTTMEMAAMLYFMSESPAPMLFTFSDDGNLKDFVNNKFDPLLAVNPDIQALLKSESRKSSGDTMKGKQFPGGYIKFVSGNSEASLRGASAKYIFCDEIDATTRTRGGDLKVMVTKRGNSFGNRAKFTFSSTPLNGGKIYNYLENSTFNKYFMPCPHCGLEMTFELDYLRWDADGNTILNAYMECPHCHELIRNEQKRTMLPKGHWEQTNLEASKGDVGFYLPSFYAPVGWVDWTKLAQEYFEAGFTSKGLDYTKMTAFYNTVLAQEYRVGAGSSDWKPAFDEALKSSYKRGLIPSWVNILTSATDVQGNRLETTIVGWGAKGRHLTLDSYIFPIPKDESMDEIDNLAWQRYQKEILNGIFIREDGFVMKTLANALDSGYLPDTIYSFYLSCDIATRERLFPIKGTDRDIGGYHPLLKRVKRKGLEGAIWYEVPSSTLKHKVYEDLKNADNEEHNMPFVCFFPNDFDQEWWMQIFSENWLEVDGKMLWVKNRDRNEQLDLQVYNYAMFYHLSLDMLTDEDWDDIAEQQKNSINAKKVTGKPRGRRVSKSINFT